MAWHINYGGKWQLMVAILNRRNWYSAGSGRGSLQMAVTNVGVMSAVYCGVNSMAEVMGI
jgi:hypothetical protein